MLKGFALPAAMLAVAALAACESRPVNDEPEVRTVVNQPTGEQANRVVSLYGVVTDVGGSSYGQIETFSLPPEYKCSKAKNAPVLVALKQLGTGMDPAGECGKFPPYRKWQVQLTQHMQLVDDRGQMLREGTLAELLGIGSSTAADTNVVKPVPPGTVVTNPPGTVVTPVPPGEAVRTAGCWIDIYEDENFKGEHRRIEGPAALKTLHFGDVDWTNDVESVILGPNAWVIVYKDGSFVGKRLNLMPNQKIADLDDFDFNNEIDSIELFDRPPVPTPNPPENR